MSKSTRELKDAVEARIDIEQRNQIIQILAREGTLDEQTTDKLQHLMREVERREEHQGGLDKTRPADVNPLKVEANRPPPTAMPNMAAEEKPLPPPRETIQPNIKEFQAAKENANREKLADLERRNLEMSQALEQLTKEKENLAQGNIPHHDDFGANDLAYRIRDVTSRFDKEETSWIRIYWPIIAIVLIAAMAVWAFFTFSPLWTTL